MKQGILLMLIAITTAGLYSCTGPGAVTTPPPAKTLTANESFKWGGAVVLKKFIFPTGTYRPTYEDKAGWYYSAPTQITVKDFPFTYKNKGGIYWKRTDAKPSDVYIEKPAAGSYAHFPHSKLPVTINR